MEPNMINLKVLSTAAAMALLLPMVAASTGSAQGIGGRAEGARGGGGGGAAIGGGGGGFRGGGGGGAAIGGGGGGGFRGGAASAPSMGGAPAGFRPAPTMGFRPTPGTGGGPVVSGGSQGNYYGGGGRYAGGGYRHHHHRHGGFWPGVAVGVGIGSTYGYYGSPSYYDDSYGYYDEGVVAAAPAGDDAVAYCMQRYKSYDPASGTYLGYDGQRHPCPAQ
jgi:hypothetical protein